MSKYTEAIARKIDEGGKCLNYVLVEFLGEQWEIIEMEWLAGER